MQEELQDPAPPLPLALRLELELVYSQVEREIASLGAACWRHGECCDFERMDHRLYASSVEVAYASLAGPAGNSAHGRLCPFWRRGSCTARKHRPLGCRTYFCDPRYRETLEAIYETHYGHIRRLARQHGYPWSYGPFVPAIRACPASP